MDSVKDAPNRQSVSRPASERRADNKGYPTTMEWTRSETLALAATSCTQCHGLGLRTGRQGVATPCQCVFRAIFRACHQRFRHCVSKEKHMSRISFERAGSGGRFLWGRKDEEFIADFTLVSRRTLDEEEYRLFKYHFLLGADFNLCCRQLKMNRGNFFHAVYRIQQKLGKTFRELKPYALYPLDEYFGSTGRLDLMAAQPAPVIPIRALNMRPASLPSSQPVKKAA